MNAILRKMAISFVLIMIWTVDVPAQGGLTRVSGNVKDIEGEVLPYTTIRLKNTSTGCITDYNGNFSFNAKE